MKKTLMKRFKKDNRDVSIVRLDDGKRLSFELRINDTVIKRTNSYNQIDEAFYNEYQKAFKL